jgi:hypothetical protein
VWLLPLPHCHDWSPDRLSVIHAPSMQVKGSWSWSSIVCAHWVSAHWVTLNWAFYYSCQAFEMALIIFYPFAMPWECVWSHKTIWQKQWSNSDETVMEQWCLWFELFNIICKVLRWHWWNYILLQCIWSVIMHLLVTKDPLTKTVIRQWWDSDATVMQQWCLWFRLFCVIFMDFRCHWSYFILLQ